jgi:hypothetical protein
LSVSLSARDFSSNATPSEAAAITLALRATGAFHLPPVAGDSASVEELLVSAKCDFMQVIDAPQQIRAELFCVSMTR